MSHLGGAKEATVVMISKPTRPNEQRLPYLTSCI